jgi:hypothetical protein
LPEGRSLRFPAASLWVAELNPEQVVGLVSEPRVDLSGWVSGFEDHGTTPATVQAFAVCAPGSAK